MQPAPLQLTPAHRVLMQDLQTAGVTDILSDTSFTWLNAAPLAQQNPQPTTQAQSTPTFRPTPTATPVAPPPPAPQPTISLPEITEALTLTGTPEKLLIVTGAFHTQGKNPFSADELTLLTNMLKAINIDITQTAVLACSVADPHGTPYPEDFKHKLTPAVQTQIKQIAAPATLLLGQVASQLATGETQTLSQSRETAKNGTWDTTTPTATTYHPRHLLKQPQFKRLAWQDLLSFQNRMQKGAH